MTEVRQLLTTAQVADLLGKSTRTIHRMVESGALPPVQKLDGTTGAYVFERADVERLRAELAPKASA